MPAPSRLLLNAFRRSVAAALARSRAQLAALVLTMLAAALLLPGPWDASSAEAAKERVLPEVEVAELRSARTKTMRQADGSLKTTLSEHSLHYLDRSEKQWKEIDASFKDSQKQNTRWESGANRFSVELSETAKQGFLTFRTDVGSLSLSLEGGSAVTGLKARGNAVTFKDALPDVDLEYAVLPDGLKESIVLREQGAPNEYRFRLVPGQREKWRTEEVDGAVSFYVDARPEPVFTLLPPVVGDSAGQALPQPDTAIQAPKSFTAAPGKAAMKVAEENGAFIVTLTIDAAWLRDPSRVFPVVLDPTLYVQPDVADGYYDTTNGGNPNVLSPELLTGRDGASGARYASVVTFDLGSLPPGAKVLDARVYLHWERCFGTGCGSPQTGDVALRRLTSGWSATTPWSSVATDSTVLASRSFASTPTATWYAWSGAPLTGAVQSFVNGSLANYGFIAEKSGGTDSLGWGWRSSRYADPSFAPYLEVYWTADGVQMNPSQHLHANGAELFWQHYTGGTSAYADEVFADTPSAYWRLDEGAGSTSAWDWSGNDRTATYSGGYTLGASGALADLDSAVTFDGSTGKATGPALALANSSFSVEAFAKRFAPGSYDFLLGQGTTAANQGLHVGFRSTNEFTCAFYNNDLNTPQYTDTNWHHWVCTYDAATNARKIYRDGELVASDTASADYAGTGAFTIGDAPLASTDFNGTVDEVAVYPAVLSPARVSAHYAAADDQLPGFQRFEIHRSATAGFTPSAATLVGTVADAAIQHFRDTSAKPEATFYYEVVTVTDEGSFSSNELKSELPAQGFGQVTIQPGFLSSSAAGTHITEATPTTEAGNSQGMVVGSSPSGETRALITFDMRLVPTGATVGSAKLELYALGTTPATNAHRLSAMWWEGGATWNHREKYSSQYWATPGGDFDSSPIAGSAGGSHQHWDSWELGSLVQDWIDGTSASFGVLLKYGSENGTQPTLTYAADGFSRSAALRPRLVITYEDGSEAVSPTVAISQPQSDELVKGTISVKAGALDDGSVSEVQFFLDGTTSLGTDSTAPYEVAWNTTGASRGSHTLTAKATDEAGNLTTSPGVQVTVANSAAPTGVSVSASPQGQAANVPPTASASATPTSGAAPLDVDFTGAGNDPDGSIAAWAWDLDGDGAFDDSSVQSPSFEYGSNGLSYARLRVTDDDGAVGFSTPVTIDVGSAGSAPTVVGTATTGSAENPTSGSWTLPSGWEAGDLLLVWWHARNGGKTITEDTAITEKVNSNAGSNPYGRLFVGYRYLQAGDSNPTWTASSWGSNTTDWGALVLRGGPSSGDPFEAASSVLGTQDSADPDPPAVTTLSANALVLTFMGKNNTSGTHTPPSGYTERAFVEESAGSDSSGAVASKVKASSGAENPGAWDLGGAATDDSVTWTASVPSGGGGGGNELPSASDAATPTSGAAPLDVDFTGSGNDPDGTITGWAWDLDGDGAYDDASAQNPSHTYTQAGTYRAWLRVTDDEGAYGFSGPVTVTVTNAANVPPTASASATPTSGAAPLDVDFTGSGNDPDGSIAAWAWDLDGDGAFDDSTVQNPSFQYGSNGLSYARLRVTDDDGAVGFSTPVTIDVGSAGSAPTVVGTPTTGAGNDPTSGTWTLPTGWQEGDLALVWWYARNGAKQITEQGTITQKHDAQPINNNYGRFFLGYRYLQASDSDPTWIATSSAGQSTMWGAIVIRGGPLSGDPFEAESAIGTFQNVQNPDPPSVTTLTGNALVLTFLGKNNDAAGSFAAPSGYTLRGTVQDTDGTDGSAGVASLVKASAGAEDPGAWTLGGAASDDGVLWTAALPPSGGGGGNALPSASVSATPTSGAAPLDVDFTGSGNDPDGSIAAWAWDLDGDGAYDDSSSQNPSHTYTQAGAYRAWLRVTDDEGAYGFSGPVTVMAGVSGSLWEVTASATDDVAVDRVEFYANGDRFATDTSPPYAATWDTLDEAGVPGYDGIHAITACAYDEDENVTTSQAMNVAVTNTTGTKYRAAISTSNVPLEQSYDPGGGAQDGAPLSVSLTNNSAVAWPTAEVKLRYRWYSADATPVVTDSANVSIGADLGAGQQRNVSMTVDPPSLPTGVYRARYKLRIDLFDTAASTYFAAEGNKPFETWVTVTREVADELGLERYPYYSGEDLGGGFDSALNLANGNSVVQWVPFSQPGRGINTVVTMTYNSLEHGSVSPLGNNWSLSISSLTPFGLPLDVHPNAADTAAGRTQKWIGFTDGDGTYHVFTGNGAGTYYTAPPGVHLYLKVLGGGGYELYKPDRTKFSFDAAGFPTSVSDANGNALTFTLATPGAGEDAYGLAKRVTTITDAGGRDFTVSYYSKAETPLPAMRGKVKKITDHVGHALEFSYYEDGNLRSIREQGGPGDDGMPTPDREAFFTYTTPDGTGPAIGTLAGRQNPDPETVQSPKLYSLVDFRGNETAFEYSTAADAKKWRVTSRTNRTGNETTFAYDTTARETTETMPLSRVWTYAFDTEGRVTEIEDPVNAQPTTVEWADETAPNEVTNTVRKVTQPSGEFVEYAYNANGYKTDEWDELRNHQTFEYESIAVDGNDASGNWEAGRSIPHLSQLSALVKPVGNETTGNPDDYRWEFAYTGTGLVDTISDPLGNVTDNAWNANGTLTSQTLPNNGDSITRMTTYSAYDANGLPTQVTDAAGGVAKAGYAANGNLLFEQDPNHGSYTGGTPSEYQTQHFYDAFGRLTGSSQPKSTVFAPGTLIWEGQAYDANDNEVASVAAHYGRGDGRNGPLTTSAFDPLDRETLVTGPREEDEGGPVQTKTEYDTAGRVIRITKPKGVNSEPSGGAWEKDFTTETAFDLLDREQAITAYAVDGSGSVDNAATRITNYCYDDAGDLRSVTGPKGAASFTSCPNPAADPYVYTSATHTTKFVYDDAHRQIKQIDALANETETGYDENGEVTSETDEADKVTEIFYDDRGLKAKLVEPFDGADTVTTIWEYDPLGNVKRLISPRAFDAAGGQAPYTDYVESYTYDALLRLVATTLPANASTPQAYRHQAYDANGNTLWTSLPTTASTPAGVTSAEKTLTTYWDTGSVYASQDPANPKVRFDYTADGSQASRVPEIVGSAGWLDYAKSMYWQYFSDGLLSAHVDQQRQRALYTYDSNGNKTQALEATGIVSPGQTPLTIELAHNSLDELSKVRTPKPGVSGTWMATLLGYDLHGNTSQLTDNREESTGGAETTAGRVFTYTYNAIDQSTEQVDDFATSANPTDDERITYSYKPTGELDTQTLEKRPSGPWDDEQSSVRTYFENGLLKTLVNRNGAASPQTIESHTLSYLSANVYLNGNRVSDVFQLKGPDASASCYATTCTASWTYDARERLTQEVDGTGKTTNFTLDVQGNVTFEQTTGQPSITRTYAGQQLATEDFSSGQDKRYFYDSLGSVDCAVQLAYSGSTCPAPGDSNLLDDNVYDYKSRLAAYRYYNGAASASKAVDYTNDPLDRPVKQVETISGSTTTYDFTYVGVTNALSREVLTGGTSTTKKYAHDIFGLRATITEGSNRYSYLFNPHADVSLLIDQNNAVKESYGYAGYGATNAALTKSASGFNNQTVPKNQYRYTGKRLDAGSGTYDMGARRYSASTGRFLQYDVYYGALQNLGLSQNPLAQNRYALAGANPINFIELDGHVPLRIDDGGGAFQRNLPFTTCVDFYTCTDNTKKIDWLGLLEFGLTLAGGGVAGALAKTAVKVLGKPLAKAGVRVAVNLGQKVAQQVNRQNAARLLNSVSSAANSAWTRVSTAARGAAGRITIVIRQAPGVARDVATKAVIKLSSQAQVIRFSDCIRNTLDAVGSGEKIKVVRALLKCGEVALNKR